MNINNVTIVGNVTRDPELRYTPSGVALVTFGVACNKRWFDKAKNDFVEDTSFFDVTAWRTLGENVAESCPKGTRVLVTGELKQRTWETDEGDKRSKVELVADCVGPALEWATATVVRNERTQAENPAPGMAGAHVGPSDDEPF